MNSTTVVGELADTRAPAPRRSRAEEQAARRVAARREAVIAQEAARGSEPIEAPNLERTPNQQDPQQSFDELFGTMQTGLRNLTGNIGRLVSGQESAVSTNQQLEIKAITENIALFEKEEAALHKKATDREGFEDQIQEVSDFLAALRAKRRTLMLSEAPQDQEAAGLASARRNLEGAFEV